MDLFDLAELEICPWALREGVILERLDQIGVRRLIALSTASVYPESTANGFELASRLGYDAVEVMVGIDPVSQEVDAVRHLSEYHEIPVCAVHAPCLLITQRVWGTEPVGQARAERRDGRRGGRRRGRRAPAVPVAARLRARRSSRASPSSRRAPASRSRSRTCTPGGPPGARCRSTCPGWDPSEQRLRQRHHRPVALRGRRAPTRWRWPSGSATGCGTST